MCVQTIDIQIPPWQTCVKRELDHAWCTRANMNVCARASYLQLAQGNTWHIICMCGKNTSIVSTPRIRRGTSLLPAAEIFSSARATRAAAPDICHAYAYALLQLHVIVCLWSWVVCAWELDRQPPRSATTKGCHMSCVVPISYRTRTVRVPKRYRYQYDWYMTITRGK